MRPTLIAAALLLAAAAPPATPPADQTSPAQDAAQDMMLIYEDVCLGHFPSLDGVRAAAADDHATKLTDEAARGALLGHAGSAWTINAPHGPVVVAVDTPPLHTCVVTGKAAEDEGVRAVFDLMVSSTAQSREFGPLVKAPVRTGDVGGRAASIQLIGAAPGGGKKQAFINMGVTNADGSMQLRLTREVAP